MTQDQLSFFAGILCLIMTAFISGLHVVSSKKRDRWMNLPAYVRLGLMAALPMSLWRGIQFLSPSPVLSTSPGTIQVEGVMFLLVLTYILVTVSFWVASRHLTDKGWDRVRHVEESEKRDPSLVPVMMTQDEVVDVLRLGGAKAVAPKARPHELNDRARLLQRR